jgi:hypothetical protein
LPTAGNAITENIVVKMRVSVPESNEDRKS